MLTGRTIALFCDFAFEDMEVMYPKLRRECSVGLETKDCSNNAPSLH